MKKLLAIISAVTVFAAAFHTMILPATAAADVETLVLEENGTAYLNGSAEFTPDYGRIEETGSFTPYKSAKGNDGFYKYHYWTEGAVTNRIKYYPKLTKGTYKVSVFVPAEAYHVGVDAQFSDGQTVSVDIPDLDYGYAGPGGFVEYGTLTATGEYGKDYVELYQRMNNMHAGYNYNTAWCSYFDAVKFELVAKAEKVNTLILEENQDAYLNGNEMPVTTYGEVKETGTFNVAEGAKFHNNKGKTHNWTPDAVTNRLKYYPRLDKGKYKVYVYVTTDAYQVGVDAQFSDGQTISVDNPDLDYGYAGPGDFVEYGTLTATGEYGKDYVELYQRMSNMHPGYNYHGGWGVCFDAVKFELLEDKPKPATAHWSLDTENAQDSVAKYTWQVTKGAAVNTESDGLKAKGWKIERPTIENDDVADANTGIKITVPENLSGKNTFTINAWIRNDKIAWYQQIFDVIQNNTEDPSKAYRLASVRFKNSLVEAHMRAAVGDLSVLGESAGEKEVITDAGTWHMVTLVYSANTSTWGTGALSTKIYYDGEYACGRDLDNPNGAWNNTLKPYTEIYIGSTKEGTNRFNGTIDEVSFYEENLTEADIMKIYKAEKRPLVTASDNVMKMADATRLSADNSVVINAEGVQDINADYILENTLNGVFENDIIYAGNIPEGIYVSNVKAENGVITVTFAGNAVNKLLDDEYISISVKAYNNFNANSDSVIAEIVSYNYMLLDEVTIYEDGTAEAIIKNKAYYGVDDNLVDAVAAVYAKDGTMKDVYLEKDIIVPENGGHIIFKTKPFEKTADDVMKIFIFDSIGTINPLLIENI